MHPLGQQLLCRGVGRWEFVGSTIWTLYGLKKERASRVKGYHALHISCCAEPALALGWQILSHRLSVHPLPHLSSEAQCLQEVLPLLQIPDEAEMP